MGAINNAADHLHPSGMGHAATSLIVDAGGCASLILAITVANGDQTGAEDRSGSDYGVSRVVCAIHFPIEGRGWFGRAILIIFTLFVM